MFMLILQSQFVASRFITNSLISNESNFHGPLSKYLLSNDDDDDDDDDDIGMYYEL
jgi:hypothetical protein